ncbi:MAG: efflux RND transporter periplasmic adaptor subunit [Betaproteobacteria bacterium]|nr:efflux RND transporter periplasmic adaptor subunit [Betaproteobacteria bacterium]
MTRWPAFLAAALLVAACGDKPAEKKGALPVLVTATQAQVVAIEIVERTLGTLEAVNDPKVGAEIAGKVVEVAARTGQSVVKGQLLARIDPTDAGHQATADSAEIARLEALLAQQERVLARQSELVQKNFISKNALDDATAQRDALKNQLATARARAELSRNALAKTRVVAPVAGIIETQVVAPGDYVKLGDPLFRMVSNARLRANLPFPESAAARLTVGQAVRLSSPLAPEAEIAAVVEDIRPTVGDGNRALEVIARLDNPGPLKSGGSVDAAVVTGRREQAVVVPEQAVVLRPAGKVVYLIVDGKAQQQVVDTGSKQKGVVEIVAGLRGGERLALDGAGFLSDGAAVNVKETAKTAAGPQGAPKPK